MKIITIKIFDIWLNLVEVGIAVCPSGAILAELQHLTTPPSSSDSWATQNYEIVTLF